MANSRASSSKSSVDMSKPHVVVCPNGVIACWHPKTAFPYEHTRPIDKADMSFQKAKDQSVFNDAVMTDYEKSKMRRGPNNAELREIFYTNKHEWYSRTREDRLYDTTPTCMIRRFCSTLPPSTSNKARDSIFKRILATFSEQQDNAFREETVLSMHEKDAVNRKEWALIYRDVDGTRSQFFTGLGIPVVLGVTAFGIYDAMVHEEEDRTDFVKRLIDDAEELGVFVAIPITLGVMVVAVLARLHTLRVYRIYQNKRVPEEYVAVVPKMGLQQQKVSFIRETSCVTMPDELQDIPRLLYATALGNVVLGSRRLLIQDEAFRVNSMRSYMLNETSHPPRLEEL
ncbi:hypothetical protein QR680_005901 [Steinernema hermaphroditum]|uniref:Large ribosomal subunit protein mL42 n=1 Tax=Steinernema hermaphroditum TaxID=289476 RepID=A0AA39LVP0_9BILA|nr:hypothetical protein QR680_005901 [Steinernema hermaphroditum]